MIGLLIRETPCQSEEFGVDPALHAEFNLGWEFQHAGARHRYNKQSSAF
jgi:hypothetical protein